MKVKDIPILKQRVIDILPITQSELWKQLKIDHRDASEIVSIMVKENLIKKTKIDHTFMLESPSGDKNKREQKFKPLISGSGKFSPCSGCPDECSPAYCKKLTEWLLDNQEKNIEKNIKQDIEEKNIEKNIKQDNEMIKDKIREKKKRKDRSKMKDRKIVILNTI